MDRRSFLRLAAAGAALQTVGVSSASTVPAYEPLGRLPIEKAKEVVVSADGTTAYLAVTDGFAIADVSDPANPSLQADKRGLLAEHEHGPLHDIWDVSVDGDRLLVVGPAHGRHDLNAALLYDVSDPAAPSKLAVHETEFPIHNAFLDGTDAYLTGNDGEENPIVIVDMEAVAEIGRWSLLDHDERWREVTSQFRVVHDVWVHDDLAFLAYWDAGTWLIDVSDPAAPSFVANVDVPDPGSLLDLDNPKAVFIGLPGNHHYCATDEDGEVLATGYEAWGEDASRGPGGIDLWDVSTPPDPMHLAHIDAPPTPDPSRQGTWTTSHNFDLAGGRLYSSWYQGGVKIHDVSDPANPEEIAWWRNPDETRFWAARQGDGCVVASSIGPRGTNGTQAALYTFPDRAGEQPDPPSLTPSPTPSSTPSPTAATSTKTAGTTSTLDGATRTGTDHQSGDPMTHTPTASPTDSPALTPSSQSDAQETPTDAGTTRTTGQSGFGALAALAGMGIAVKRYVDGGRK